MSDLSPHSGPKRTLISGRYQQSCHALVAPNAIAALALPVTRPWRRPRRRLLGAACLHRLINGTQLQLIGRSPQDCPWQPCPCWPASQLAQLFQRTTVPQARLTLVKYVPVDWRFAASSFAFSNVFRTRDARGICAGAAQRRIWARFSHSELLKSLQKLSQTRHGEFVKNGPRSPNALSCLGAQFGKPSTPRATQRRMI